MLADDVPFYDLGSIVCSRRPEYEAAFAHVLDGGHFIGGADVEEFEIAFAAYVGVEHCITVGNGLDALRIALECAGVGPGDEVLVPGFTFFATWLAVMQTGARPVPVDVDVATASIDVAKLADSLSPYTRAVLPVHLYGIPADMAAIGAVAGAHELIVIEDVAQAHGARTSSGARAGGAGLGGAFSFYPTKNLGALGDAGAIVTDDAGLAATARSRRSYGQGATKYEHIDTGWNSRMDSLQATFLLSALSHLDEDNARRRQIALAYIDALADARKAVIGSDSGDVSVWHHFVLRAQDREGLRSWLAAEGVATDVHYPYAFDDLEPTCRELRKPPLLGVSRSLAREVVSLPMGAWLSDTQVDRVSDALRRVPRGLLCAE